MPNLSFVDRAKEFALKRLFGRPLLDRTLWQACSTHFDATHYLETYPDVGATGVDPLRHYLRYGWQEHRSPAPWFDPHTYLSEHPDAAGENPFVHLLKHSFSTPELIQENYAGKSKKRSAAPMIDPAVKARLRPHFDTEYYLAQNPEVAASGVDPLVHFLRVGWVEGRDPSAAFSCRYYLHHNKDIQRAGLNPFDHYISTRSKEKWRRSATVRGAEILTRFEPDGDLAHYVEEAMKLDPLVGFPRGPRHHTSPLETNVSMSDATRKLRSELAGEERPYIVLVPHVRMSGAARVAAILTEHLSALVGRDNIMVVVTDSSEMSYASQWFDPALRMFDLSAILSSVQLPEGRCRLLYDMLRGVGCKTLINVNSRLMWDSLQIFGRQMAQEFDVVTYLFTWDETPEGLRGGYPIQWLRHTADYHDLIFTDTNALATDIRDRLGYDTEQVTALYTPIPISDVRAAPVALKGRPRFLWAGRFDRQKRVDLLVQIAAENPAYDFDVYGKVVLDGQGLADYQPPENIHEMGTYDDLAEVLAVGYHGFVYTAQWDGLPTILLDMAQAGLPIIAPDVGGISELIDDEAGSLIADFQDVGAYSAALDAIVRDPGAAAGRAKVLQRRLLDQFSDERYRALLTERLGHED